MYQVISTAAYTVPAEPCGTPTYFVHGEPLQTNSPRLNLTVIAGVEFADPLSLPLRGLGALSENHGTSSYRLVRRDRSKLLGLFM
jgi:hypothetical protein